MEIHSHIGQSSPHAHAVAHHRYPSANDYYLHGGQYNTVSNDPHSQFDFQQQQTANPTNNSMDPETKLDQIKMEAFGSPIDPNLNSNGQFQIATSSPSSSLMQHSVTNPIDSLSPNQLNVGGLLNYAAAAFQPQLGNVLNNDIRNGGSNSKHDRKRPYPCAMCSSRFGSKMELEEHQNSHTGQKPFECDICQSRFNRRSTLWNHKRIHSDSKPFSCSVCQMTFKWKNSLKCHKEMHLRKNETSSVMDNDIKLLTYATAAKKKMAECSANGLPPAAAIQTVASRKKPSTSKKIRVKREQLQEQTVSTTTSANLSLSLFGADTQRSLLNDPQSHQQDASQHLAITHTSSHQNQQLDLSQFNHNNLLMQAIYNGNNTASNQASSNTHSQLLTNDDVSALDLLNSSSSANNSSATNLNIDLLPTAAQAPLFLDNSQFLSDAVAMHGGSTGNAAGMRLPATFPMNILDFQQQLTDRQQPQLSYIQTQQQQDVANQQLQQQTMINYQTQQRTDQALLDDVQNLYQQGALDPSSLLLHSNAQQQNSVQHHAHQQSIQTNQMLQAQNQQQPMDQFHDFMLNGNPVYQFGSHANIADGSVATAGVSLCGAAVQQQPTLNRMTFNSNMAFAANQQMGTIGTNFNIMDDVSQFSQEELQNLAKMMPFDSKW